MQMNLLLLASALLTSVAAAPGRFSFLPEYVPKNLPQYNQQTPSCDVSNVQQPSSSLPPPTGLQLVLVAIGRGTQNYTCANSTASATPAAIGAVATLYNASCIAANAPQYLSNVTTYAETMPMSKFSPTYDVVGHHFFMNTTTPTFQLDAFGTTPGRKVNSSAVAQPNVAWLYILPDSTSTTPIKAAYRLETANGAPPANCNGQPSAFEVQYAATYWFYT